MTNLPSPVRADRASRPANGSWPLVLGAFLASGCLAVLVGLVAYLVAGPTSSGSWYNRYLILFWWMVFFAASLFFVYREQAAKNPDRLFLWLLLILTVGTSLLYDINQVGWDVGTHFGFMINWTGMLEPRNLSWAEARLVHAGSNVIETNLHDLGQWKDLLNSEVATPHDSLTYFGTVTAYTRLSSLPALAVYLPLVSLGVPFSWAYVLGKLPNAVIYSYVCYRSMRKLKSGKMIVATVSMIPTALVMAENYSYDFWINCFTLWAITMIVGTIQRPHEKMSGKRTAAIIVLFAVGLSPKTVYAPLMLLAFLVPQNRYRSRSSCIACRTAIVVACLAVLGSMFLPMLVGGGPSEGGDMRGGSDVSQSGQISYVLANFPHYIFGILLPYMLQYLNPVDSQLYLGWNGYLGLAPIALSLVSFGLLIFACVTDHTKADERVCTAPNRWVVGIICWCTLCIAASALYVNFTPVGSDTIEGFQSRYILPVLYPMLGFYGLPRVGAKFRAKRPSYNLVMLGVLTAVPLVETWILYVGLIG